jgi:hypothetical protein
MQCLIHSFKYFGGVPQHILFDNMKIVTDGREQGVVKWNERFAKFTSYYAFTPKACFLDKIKNLPDFPRGSQLIPTPFVLHILCSVESLLWASAAQLLLCICTRRFMISPPTEPF